MTRKNFDKITRQCKEASQVVVEQSMPGYCQRDWY